MNHIKLLNKRTNKVMECNVYLSNSPQTKIFNVTPPKEIK